LSKIATSKPTNKKEQNTMKKRTYWKVGRLEARSIARDTIAQRIRLWRESHKVNKRVLDNHWTAYQSTDPFNPYIVYIEP
jgi:hypothetical protein